MTPSPWWYRRRALVMGALYAAGFFGAVVYAQRTATAYVSVAQILGHAGPWLAVLLMCAGVAVRIWGASYLQSATVWSANSLSDRLVIAGPFRYTRNPLYLGNVLIALAFGMLASPLGMLFIVMSNLAFAGALIQWEERGMRVRSAGAFAAYCAAVPRLFPRVKPCAAETDAQAHLAEGLRSEIFALALLAGMLAVVLDPQYGWAIFGMLYLFGITTQTVLARKRATA